MKLNTSLLPVAVALSAASAFAQEPVSSRPFQVDFSAGVARISSVDQATSRIDISRTDALGGGLKADFTANFIGDDSLKQTLKNELLMGHVTQTAARQKGRATLSGGVGASREFIFASRLNAAGPVASAFIMNKHSPVYIGTRLDLGSIGLIGTKNSAYAGIAIDVATMPIKSVTAFSSNRLGMTGDKLRASVSGIIWNLEALNKKAPVSLTIAKVSDHQRVGDFKYGKETWVASATVRLKTARIAR